MKTEKFKVTPLERAWILYDVGNSAFVLMIATLVPIFFNALAEAGGVSKVDYLAYWGYASSIVTVVTAILSPILGTLADTKGFKKPIFMLCLFVGVLGCCAMGAARTWLPFLVIFIVAAILTPPDVFSQCLMALPMLVLYEVSIYVSAMAYKKKEDKKSDDEDKEEA